MGSPNQAPPKSGEEEAGPPAVLEAKAGTWAAGARLSALQGAKAFA